ncbi:beta-lactamase family protein [Yoonia sp. F2084L]|uniref:serine hydrolase domain-containing protein n=1 Tax=Yoonia sp. F2084L TaxID=2926419 RepID=UPI001FF20737|nr:serine hydrolase domain-containing protein [Yoonia sp. F2084L]MCK0097342.1 beta-lactamase family protein [Yoonia sp. F2084L]
MTQTTQTVVHGVTTPEFDVVRQAFAENFAKRNELGGACCVYLNGEKVVDLWGGVRDPQNGAAWDRDTMVIVFSLTKGMSAMTLALAHSRGLLDYDERVAHYWPEFAQSGKQAITVRQLLSHQAGLHAFHAKIDRATIADQHRLAIIMARETPAWPPGTRNAYHFLSLGFYESELLRRVDPAHRSLGQFFRDEIADPLDLEFHIGLPADIPNARLAPLTMAGFVKSILAYPPAMILTMLNPWSAGFRACIVNPGAGVVMDKDRIYARDLEVPSGGGVGTARAIAKAYGVFATKGAALGLSSATLAALSAPATPPTKGHFDEVLRGDAQYSLGFMKPFEGFPFGHPSAFGTPGAGGSLGYADPAIGLGYGYVTNRIGTGVDPDPRDVALRDAIKSVVG